MSVDWAGIGSVLKELINLLAAAGVFVTIYFAAKAKYKAEEAVKESKVTTTKVESLTDTVGDVKIDMKKVEAHADGMRTAQVDAEKKAELFRGQLLGMEKQKAEGKEDAKDVREQIKEATETLAKVQITGEKTNVAVEEVKDIVKNGNHNSQGEP